MGEPFNAETSGLRHFVALIRALNKFYSNFANWVRGRAEGQKTFYTLAVILGEPSIVEISGLRHFLALVHAQIILFWLFPRDGNTDPPPPVPPSQHSGSGAGFWVFSAWDQSSEGSKSLLHFGFFILTPITLVHPPELWDFSVIFPSPWMDFFYLLNFFLLYYVFFYADSKKLNII